MSVTLTGNLPDVIGAEDAEDLALELVCNQSALVDPATGETWMPERELQHVDGAIEVELPDGDVLTLWQVKASYTVRRPQNRYLRRRVFWRSGWFPVPEDTDLADRTVVLTDPVNRETVGNITLLVADANAERQAAEEAASDAETFAAEAEAFGGTNNTQVAGMVTGTGPTKDALSVAFDAPVLPSTAYAKGDLRIAPNGAVVQAKAAFTTGPGGYVAGDWQAAPDVPLLASRGVGGVRGFITQHEAIARTLGWTIGTDPKYGASTAAVDNGPAINAALAAAPTRVWLPPGTFEVKTRIDVPHQRHLIGAGSGTVLKWTGAADVYMVRNSDSLDASVSMLQFDCNDLANWLSLSVDTGTNQGFRALDVTVRKPRIGFAVNPENATLGPQIDDWAFVNVRMVASDGNTTFLKGAFINSQNSTGTLSKVRMVGVAAAGAAVEVKGSLLLNIYDLTTGGSSVADAEASIRVVGSQGVINVYGHQAEKVTYMVRRTATAPAEYRPINLYGVEINDPIRFDSRGRLNTFGCDFYGSAGTVLPLVIFNDHRNQWHDSASNFAYNAAGLAAYLQMNGTNDLVNLFGTSMDGTTEMVVPARVTHVGLEKTTIRGGLAVSGALTAGGRSVRGNTVVIKTANYTAAATDETILANGATLINLPAAATAGNGRTYTIKNLAATALEVRAADAGNIDNTTVDRLGQHATGLYVSDGTQWYKAGAQIGHSATLDFPSIAAGATAQLTVSVPGAIAGQAVALGPPSGIEAGLMWSGYVSAAGTVTVRLHNTTGAAIDPASGVWTARVLR